jgi:glycosyltransferase involved in cell wall biosynthesis
MARLSIIMPVLDEGEGISRALDALAELRGLGVETIVVDGGSRDATVQRARMRVDRVVLGSRGRAVQMNEGADIHLHADTRLPPETATNCRSIPRAHWARVGLLRRDDRGPPPALHPLVAWLMNLRSRLTGIATGDRAIFVRRRRSGRGRLPPIALMEDVALSRLKRVSKPLRLRARATSGQRSDGTACCGPRADVAAAACVLLRADLNDLARVHTAISAN